MKNVEEILEDKELPFFLRNSVQDLSIMSYVSLQEPGMFFGDAFPAYSYFPVYGPDYSSLVTAALAKNAFERFNDPTSVITIEESCVPEDASQKRRLLAKRLNEIPFDVLRPTSEDWLIHLPKNTPWVYDLAIDSIFSLNAEVKLLERSKLSLQKEYDLILESFNREDFIVFNCLDIYREIQKELHAEYNYYRAILEKKSRTARGALRRANIRPANTDKRKTFRKRTSKIYKNLDDEDHTS